MLKIQQKTSFANVLVIMIIILAVIIIDCFSIAKRSAKAEEIGNIEGVQTINGIPLERAFQGDESPPIPVNETPEEYQNRKWKETDALLRQLEHHIGKQRNLVGWSVKRIIFMKMMKYS